MVDSPLLATSKFQRLLATDDADFAHHKIDLTFSTDQSLEQRIKEICAEATPSSATR